MLFVILSAVLSVALSVTLSVILSVVLMSSDLLWCWLHTVSTFTYFVRAVLRPLILVSLMMTVNDCRIQWGHFEHCYSEQKTVKTAEVMKVLQKRIEDDILIWVFSESSENEIKEEKKKKYEHLWLICCIRLSLTLSSVWIFLTFCLTVFFFFSELWL